MTRLSHHCGPIMVTAQMILVCSTPSAQSCQGKKTGVWSRGTRSGTTTTNSNSKPSSSGTRPIRMKATNSDLMACQHKTHHCRPQTGWLSQNSPLHVPYLFIVSKLTTVCIMLVHCVTVCQHKTHHCMRHTCLFCQNSPLFASCLLTVSLSAITNRYSPSYNDTQHRITLNTGKAKSSRFIGDTAKKTVEGESMKQLSPMLPNSHNQGQTWQHPCVETRHVKKL